MPFINVKVIEGVVRVDARGHSRMSLVQWRNEYASKTMQHARVNGVDLEYEVTG